MIDGYQNGTVERCGKNFFGIYIGRIDPCDQEGMAYFRKGDAPSHLEVGDVVNFKTETPKHQKILFFKRMRKAVDIKVAWTKQLEKDGMIRGSITSGSRLKPRYGESLSIGEPRYREFVSTGKPGLNERYDLSEFNPNND
jgi:hypothetical protein